MKKFLIASGVAVLAFATIVSAQGYTFNTNLTVGSTGADVSALQTWLIANGFNIPAISSGAASKGYFGAQTAAAAKMYQASVGLPNTGFVGPLTRAKLNAGSTSMSGGATCPAGYSCTPTTPVASTCPAGYQCVPIGGGTPMQGTGATGITTPGVPGIISITQGPLSSSVINVGSTMVPLITVRVQAQYSDLAVQSMNVDLGNNTSFFNKLFNKIYVTDNGNVDASQPLNNSTVVQSGSNYIVGLAGFNIIVPKGTYKDIVIKGDLNSSIDSAYLASGASYPNSGTGLTGLSSGWGVGIDTNGVRAVDGAGINLNGPSSAIAQGITINKSLVDNATANISLDPTSPLVASNPVTDTTNNQYLGLPVLTFDVNAQNDTLHLHEVKVRFGSSGQGSITAAYLYQGSTQIMSASVSGGLADFNNIVDGTAGASIPVNTTVPFTVKVDVSSVTSDSSAFNVVSGLYSTTTTEIIAYNSIDSNATITGSAVGNQQTVTKSGPAFALTGTPTITKTVISTDTNGHATTSYAATFNVQVTAVGTNVALGLPASSTPAFIGSGFTNTATASTSIGVYKNGQQASLAGFYPNTTGDKAVTASYSQPTGTTVSSDGTYFTVSRNQTVTIPVTFTWLVRDAGSNSYAGQLDSINWYGLSSGGPSTFMQDQPSWRTATSQ